MISKRESRVLHYGILAAAVVLAVSGTRRNAPSQPIEEQERYITSSPFRDLYTLARVTTSNDEHWISYAWLSSAYSLQFPDRPLWASEGALDAESERPWIAVRCRTDGRPDGYSGPLPLAASLLLPLHPDEPNVPNVINPRYWWRALTGGEFVTVPVGVSVASGPAYDSELVRHTIDYSFARPDLIIDLEPVSVLEALRDDGGATLIAAGQGTLVELVFLAADTGPLVAGLMLEHCPK